MIWTILNIEIHWHRFLCIACIGYLHCDYGFDYWGKGTMVTVSSASSTAPTLFPLAQCGSGTGDMMTLGCIATGFTPASLTFKWNEQGGNSLTDFVQYPVVQTGGSYTGVSQLRVKRADWDSKIFECAVEHSAGSKTVPVKKQVQRVIPPNITLYPLWEELEGGSKVGLLCILSGFYPDKLSVEWLLDDKTVTTSPVQRKLQSVEGEEKTFSLNSQLELDQGKWTQGSEVTCKATHNAAQGPPPGTTVSRTISICSAFPSSTPSLHLETPRFRTVMTQTEVTATCVVHSAYDAKVSWLLDGKDPTSRTPVNQASSTTQSISSNLTLPSSQWKTLNTITCRAEHRCFNTTQRTSNVKGPAVSSTPTVLIRRSLPDLLDGDSAVLECAITQLSSSDLYVTFQANGVDFPEKQYVDLPASKDHHSLTRRFSIPTSHWKKDNTFTCKVNQGYSNSWASNSTGTLFGEPSMELLLVPNEELSGSGTQKLMCSGRGFNPQIKWLSGSNQRSAADNERRMREDGHVAVTSHITVTQQEWNEGKDFICEVIDKDLQKIVRKSTSLCTAFPSSTPSLHLETPRFRTVMTQTEVTATCVVHSAYDAKVSWLLDGKDPTSRTPVNQASSTTQSISSNLTLPSSQWKTLNTITCRAEHRCFNTTQRTSNVKGPAVSSTPTVLIRRSLPDLLDGDSAVLECAITQLSSSDLYVTFQANGVDFPEKHYVDLPASKDHHSLTRRFSIPTSHWKKDNTFTCKVNQGYSNSWASNSTGTLFGEPSMELLLVPNEELSGSGTQKLMCSGRGFNPQIKWLSGSNQRSAADNERRMREDGHVAVTSHITVTQQEWNEGKDFICEVIDKDLQKTVRKSTSLCTAFPSSTPSLHLETPRFRTVMTQTEVTATCVVHSAYDAKVSWLLDGKDPTSRTPVNQASSTTQSISSNLTLPSSQWKTLNTITCRAEHHCFNTTQRTSNVKGPAVSSTPTVLIRRSLPDLLDGDSAVLECAITQLSSSDLYVTFQANGVDFPEKQYVDLPASKDHHSLTRRFSIPTSHWKKDNTFTCKVNQGYSNSWASNSTGTLFGEPSMELLLVPNEELSGSGTQKLMCSGRGFNPQIKWLSGSNQRSAADNERRMREDGHVAVTSHITVTQQEWNEGKDFICEVIDKDLQKTVRKSTSLCTAFPSSTPSLHLETPGFRTVMTQTEVTATCVVHSAYDAKVSWLLDGKDPTSRTPVNQASSTTQSISSNLTLPSSQWKTLNTITCRAEHRCFNTTQRTSNVKGPAVSSTPTVLIRRSLPDLLDGDSAVLECAITQLSSSDLYVTFQANGVDFPEKQYVDLPASKDHHSLTRRFSIPTSHWKKDNTFTCKVNQGYSNSWASNSTGTLFGEPSMELLLVPNEELSGSGTQKLMCSGRGFNPQIKWLSGSNQRSAADNERRMREDGHVAVTSHITVTQQEWNEGKDFICEVIDKDLQKTVRKSTSLCTAFPSSTPSLHLETPRFRTVMTQTEVTATCVVHSAYDAKVTWLLDGKDPTSRTPVNQASSTTQSISSNLTLPSSQWKTLNTITCRAEHHCFNTTQRTSNVKGPAVSSTPTVLIRRSLPDLLDGDSAVLECAITQLSSSDLYVTFQANGVDFPEKQYVDLPASKDHHSLTRRFSIPTSHWKKDNTFTCKVNQGYSNSWASNSTGTLFGEPSMELLLVPNEEMSGSGTQKLMCSGRGFNPQIKWLSGSNQRSAADNERRMREDGHVAVTSHITVTQQEWNEGKDFICEVIDKDLQKTVRKSTSLCTAFPSSTPSLHLETPGFRTVMTQTEVTATCVVHSAYDAKVSWLLDGKDPTSRTPVNQASSTTQSISSNLTLPSSQWKTLNTITCRAEHRCFNTTQRTSNVKGPAVSSTPTVLIRRSLPDLLDGDSAVLECAITQLSSSDLYVTFQANGVDFPEKQYVDLPASKDHHSLTRRFSIPTSHWKKDNTFTCKVNQGYSNSWASNSTGTLFLGEPSMELLLVPNEEMSGSGTQKLMCSGRGFNPQIKWLSGSKQRSAADNERWMREDGHVAVTSHITVTQQEWNQGKDFTCEVIDKDLQKEDLQKTVGKSINICAVTPISSQKVGVYLQGPTLQELRTGGQVPVTCLLVGPSLGDFSVSWKVDGFVASQGGVTRAPKDHSNGTQTEQIMFNVSARDWHAHKLVSCEVKHRCSSQAQVEHITKCRDPKPPSIKIVRPSDSDLWGSNNATLLCLVSGFFPSDVIVNWEKAGSRLPFSRYSSIPSVLYAGSSTYSMNSRLIVPRSEWDQNSNYSCAVRHESSERPITHTIENVFGSVTPSASTATLLQGPSELVCLVLGFSPSDINITWLLDNVTELWNNNTSTTYRAPGGKFGIRSHLSLAHQDWTPGAVYTCRVTHTTQTLALNISKPELLGVEGVFFDENRSDPILADTAEENWNMACIFLVLFLISLLYSITVTLVKTK
ncbi:uncharacterized protein LOC115171600 isoform X2 [Salmo trutta]|uniref:uncharacterized protein LOC115171600 isoform X2 n=2 Tax=Salmo trutta TaxID=8032 RepID=UPI00112FE028|nr:uncharacterized protein LOC115171600 isoform X2 [Salmo trutta]